MDRPHEQHRTAAAAFRAQCAVVTVSDTRTIETDVGGALAERLLMGAGHAVTCRYLVPDEPEAIREVIERELARVGADAVDLVVTTGGTGIGPRDGTVEVVEALLDKTLDGFGELFRQLSYQQIGSAAMLSRAVGGLVGRAFVFALPGSPHAVELALKELILPELGHLLRERDRRSRV